MNATLHEKGLIVLARATSILISDVFLGGVLVTLPLRGSKAEH